MLCNSCQTPGNSIQVNPITHQQTGAFGKIIQIFWSNLISNEEMWMCAKQKAVAVQIKLQKWK
jgi:hypothetical protein